MSKVEKLIYELNKKSDDQKKKSEIPHLINKIGQWPRDDQIKIAQFVKEYLQRQSKWKVKRSEIKKPKSKNSKKL